MHLSDDSLFCFPFSFTSKYEYRQNDSKKKPSNPNAWFNPDFQILFKDKYN